MRMFSLLFALYLFISAVPLQAASVKIAFIGDQGMEAESFEVLKLIRAQKADALVVLGDFDYDDDPKGWDGMLTKYLGADFPVFAVIGNHELRKAKGYKKILARRLAAINEAECAGVLGAKFTCSYKGVRFVFLFPPYSQVQQAAYAQENLKIGNSPWRICAWHVPHPDMQIEGKQDPVKWDLYEICRRNGAMIMTGHSHTYSRTYLLSDFPNKTIVHKENTLEIAPGKTFTAVIGTGGRGIRDSVPARKNNPWWASAWAKEDKLQPGALFCSFGDNRKGECYFKEIGQEGRELDNFKLITTIR